MPPFEDVNPENGFGFTDYYEKMFQTVDGEVQEPGQLKNENAKDDLTKAAFAKNLALKNEDYEKL
jgi:hypothetical protein